MSRIIKRGYSSYKARFIFSFLLLLLSTVNTYSQVTIGSATPPDSNALLDLKQYSDESSNKGLLLPRVSLFSKALADPLKSHVKGMFVYNIADVDSEIYPGCYYNDGTKWIRIETNSNSGMTASVANGLNITGNTIKLGGTLIEPTAISGISSTNKLSFIGTGVDAINFDSNTLSIDAANNRVGIGTSIPDRTLHVNGTVRITGHSGTPTRLVGRDAPGDISEVKIGSGLRLSNGELTATAGTTTIINAHLISFKIKQYNVGGQTTPIKPLPDDYTVWISNNPNVGANQPHIELPITNTGRVINVVASASAVRVGVAGIGGGSGWITTQNGVNVTTFTIPTGNRVSFQYISNTWDSKGTWIVMMKDF